ncbi:hypothetical protein D1AOALGA4SA_604 [Olavius algarvensis Delta 1 endosymbiont]|nr:hypothetical protein D1AOALGA4SA_604 [Olavius algarvensis Delta 1 endosymbiont]
MIVIPGYGTAAEIVAQMKSRDPFASSISPIGDYIRTYNKLASE